MSKLNFYFGHLYYFYMKSIEKNITKTEIQVLEPVFKYNNSFIETMSRHFNGIDLIALDLFIEDKI